MNVFNYIENNARTLPGQVAIIENGVAVTYLQLYHKINELSEELSKAGVQKQNGVAVLGANSGDFIVLAFAVMKIGATVLPLPDHLSINELKGFIESSQLHYICFNKEYSGFEGRKLESQSLNSKWVLWKNDDSDFASNYAAHIEHPALVRFTSGTTGASKGVILSHKTIHDRIEAANTALQLNKNDKILWVLSMAFHFVVSIILYLKNGCGIILTNNFLAKSILEDIHKYGATFLYLSPMHVRLLANDHSGQQMSAVKKVISTSTAISKAQCDAFYNKFGIPVSQAYGIIEIGLPVINSIKSVEHPEAIGYAVEGYQVAILDENGEIVQDGETGNLAIRGPGMFDGYLNPPSVRAEVLRNGFFLTGDLAKKLSDGLVSVEGRKKSMINVGGNKVFPEEVEGVLMQLPEIKNCRVSGYQHPLLGECVMAELQLHADSKVPDKEVFYQFCKSNLSSYKVPQKIIIVDELPMTKSGKVIR